MALDILKEWLYTEYEGGRHDISLGLLREAEETLCTGKKWNPEHGLQYGKNGNRQEKER